MCSIDPPGRFFESGSGKQAPAALRKNADASFKAPRRLHIVEGTGKDSVPVLKLATATERRSDSQG